MAARSLRKKTTSPTRRGTRDGRGRLRIGNQWNAITIIALSQNSPLKAIAEFVENSIDARARNITIVRGREQGEPYLRVVDDGEGVRLNDAGVPDFDYVATHVCDSIKRRLKAHGASGIQGEFGMPGLEREPWTSDLLRGMIEAPFLQLTPGTRTPGTRGGVVFDARFATLCRALEELEPRVIEQVERERAAAEEEASRSILRSVRKALSEGLLALPNADYQWLEVAEPRRTTAAGAPGTATSARDRSAGDSPLLDLDEDGSLAPEAGAATPEAGADDPGARAFHEHAGPLYKVTVSPASAVVKVGETCTIRCLPKDRRGRTIEAGVEVSWQVVEGAGSLRDRDREVVTFAASAEPGLSVIRVTARQQESECRADASVTITESLGDRFDSPQQNSGRGIPRYTFRHAPGELWRSRYDAQHNLIVVNNGHSDFRFASEKRARELRYMLRLYAKELVLENFPGHDRGELLERMIELSLYAEEHLR